jgi:hypothetical protein
LTFPWKRFRSHYLFLVYYIISLQSRMYLYISFKIIQGNYRAA